MEIHPLPEVKSKRPPGRKAKHSETYRLMVAQKVFDEGMSYREAGKTFGLSHGSISAIVAKYKQDRGKARRKVIASKYKRESDEYRHQSHLNDLKLQIADLFLENMMLKKVLEHSRLKKKEDLSVITSESLDRSKEDAE